MLRRARSDDQFSLLALMGVVTVVAICVRLGQIHPSVPFLAVPVAYAACVLAHWSIRKMFRRRGDVASSKPGKNG